MVMRVTGNPSGRFLGYVHLQVGSRVYALPVEARRLSGETVELGENRSTLEPGFFTADAGRFGIVVDSEAPEAVVQQTIERGSADAARHISRKLLN
jgi:hypothetical protein